MSPLLLLAGLPALAVQPTDHVHIGSEPTRVRRFHAERQYSLRNGDQWQALTAGDFTGWQARFDEATGMPWQASGPGIPLGPLTDDASVDQAVRALLQRNPGLAGVDMGSLALGSVIRIADRDAWIVRYDQVLPGSAQPQNAELAGSVDKFEHFAKHGQPVVWRGSFQVGIQQGRLTKVTVKTYPDATVETPRVSAAQAVQTAIASGPKPEAQHAVEGAVRVVVPEQTEDGLGYRTAWMVRTTTGGTHPGVWVSFVDVVSGELFSVHNQVRYLDGILEAEHDTRYPDGNFSVSPIRDLEVIGTEGSDITDGTGAFSVTGSTASAMLTDGVDFEVYNDDGAEAEFTWSDAAVVWTDDDAHQAELDVYVFLTLVNDWAKLYANDIGIVQDGMRAIVNIDSACNAYYDGNVNFFVPGSGCNNTGRIKDVTFHEWGHGMHYYAARSSYVDGAVGEGISDVVSMLETDDNIMAPYFNTDGSGIRDLEPNRRYPDDYINQVHTDGLIYGGSMWDWRKLAQERLGYDDAKALVSRVAVDMMMENPELADTYDAAVFADDDDGDLSNGTPHICDLISAFGEHGLGPGGEGGGLISIGHEVVLNQPPDATSYPVAADLVNPAPDCFDSGAANAVVVWSTDGGDTWEETPLTVSSDAVTGAIPQAEPGSIIHYFLRADTDSGEVTAPLNGDRHPFSFAVGEFEEISCNDFESDDGGWTSELLAGEDTEGADDWQWGRPFGEGGDPDFAFSGNRVWGNDLGPDNYNGEYQNDRHNRLTSPEFDIAGYDRVVLQYRRWLNVEDGYYDSANILANGEVVWSNHGTDRSLGSEHTTDRQWALHTVELPTDADSVQLAFEIISDGGLTMGGWTIDDLCVYGVTGVGSDTGDEPDDTGDTGEEPGDTDTPVDVPDDTTDTTDGSSVDGDKVSGCACSTSDQAPASSWFAVLGLAGLGLLRRRRD